MLKMIRWEAVEWVAQEIRMVMMTHTEEAQTGELYANYGIYDTGMPLPVRWARWPYTFTCGTVIIACGSAVTPSSNQIIRIADHKII
jgi:hypothetical protein